MTDEHSATQGETAGTAIDTTVPHSARIWNYWLGGKDNYAVDREAGDQYREIFPGITVVARSSRGFLTRAVRYLAGEAGIRQFLDIGTGLPTADNTHQVAQQVAPESKIVYVDNDPLVLAHARALLTSEPEGAVEYLDADIRNPDAILDTAAGLLDFKQPIALMLMGIMGHFTDDEAYPIVARLQAGLPSGSYFALYDGADTNEAFKRPSRVTTTAARCPTTCAAPHGSPPSSKAWSWWSPAWCRCRTGGPTPARSRSRSTPIAGSAASRNARISPAGALPAAGRWRPRRRPRPRRTRPARARGSPWPPGPAARARRPRSPGARTRTRHTTSLNAACPARNRAGPPRIIQADAVLAVAPGSDRTFWSAAAATMMPATITGWIRW